MARSVVVKSNLNYYIVILLIFILFIILASLQSNKSNYKQEKNVIVINKKNDEYTTTSRSSQSPVYPTELPKYSPQGQPLDYQQVGILTSNEEATEPIILPLFGRKIYGRSDRWQYYTATDKNNMMRIPLQYKNRDCEDDTGCEEIYTGDVLTVDIYQGRQFTATVYKVDAPRYFASRY